MTRPDLTGCVEGGIEEIPLFDSAAWRNLDARLTRAVSNERADAARHIARPGEPHAKARARLVMAQEELVRRVERGLFFGEWS